jgi:hypothetical protein
VNPVARINTKLIPLALRSVDVLVFVERDGHVVGRGVQQPGREIMKKFEYQRNVAISGFRSME